nr:esterase-like activity of phytase family protein [Sphingomonas jinjuensis]
MLLVPGWAGEERLRFLDATARMTAVRVSLDPADPARRRVGALTFLGGLALNSPDKAFGGFSALHTDGRRFTLLSDGGSIVRFTLTPDWRIVAPDFAHVPGGPRNGQQRSDRDSESLVTDGRHVWVGFESVNEIWRYDAGFTRTERYVQPSPMRRWRRNGGPETMIRLRDGRFIVISEDPPKNESLREGLVFPGDPVRGAQPFAFRFVPPDGYNPSDGCELPDGRLLILLRNWQFPLRFASRLMIVDPATIRPGAIVTGRTIATLAAPLIHDNFEGVAAIREGGATVIWIVADDNQLILERSLLLKFRLDA